MLPSLVGRARTGPLAQLIAIADTEESDPICSLGG
jgi:hypothetical protein